MPAEKTKILILEGLKSKNRNWQNSLKNKTYLNIVGITNSINNTLYLMEIFTPDIVIIDLTYLGNKGIDAIYQIKNFNESTKIIILSDGNDEKEIFASISSKTNAYCRSDISIEALSLILVLYNLSFKLL